MKLSTIQKMLERFLQDKQVPKEKLAETLTITTEQLEQLMAKDSDQNMLTEIVTKISMPLVKLYCRTKWT